MGNGILQNGNNLNMRTNKPDSINYAEFTFIKAVIDKFKKMFCEHGFNENKIVKTPVNKVILYIFIMKDKIDNLKQILLVYNIKC